MRPLPSLEVQENFDKLQAKVRAVLAAQQAAGDELGRLLPALLEEAFGEAAASTARKAA